jgi:hypothetical protein
MIMKLNPNNPHKFTMNDFNWKNQYTKQRKNRLTDAVHDYLDEAETSILEFYNDLRDIIIEMNTYHKTFAEKAEGALLMLSMKTSMLSTNAEMIPNTETCDDDIPGDPSY